MKFFFQDVNQDPCTSVLTNLCSFVKSIVFMVTFCYKKESGYLILRLCCLSDITTALISMDKQVYCSPI